MDENSNLTLGQKIKEARTNNNMTQKQLAGDYITRNMLSQIENDLATPSIKTLYYLANKLTIPISYFLDDEYHESKKYNLASSLLNLHGDQNYLEAIRVLEAYFEKNPIHVQNDMLKNIYINSCLQAANQYKKDGEYLAAKELYDKLLTYESDMIFDCDVSLYNVYCSLSEISVHLDAVGDLKTYDKKAKDIVDKMVATRQIQDIYISFVEGDYKGVLEKIMAVDINQLDQYNKGRYYMIIGSTFYYKEEYDKAIQFLEKAVDYYKNKTYNSVIKMIYENLSKCYSNQNDYKTAYEYLSLSRE